MHRLILLAFLLCSVAAAAFAQDEDPVIKSPSPDGRFVLRVNQGENTAEIIEKASDKTMASLGVPMHEQVLVWSSDSKWFAYSNRGSKVGELSVYVWNGTAFENIELPEDLPSPDIKFPKDMGGVKNYGGAVIPLHWLKPGELRLASDATMLGRDDGVTYVGVIQFTLAFDAKHHVTVKNVGKTKTEVSR